MDGLEVVERGKGELNFRVVAAGAGSLIGVVDLPGVVITVVLSAEGGRAAKDVVVLNEVAGGIGHGSLLEAVAGRHCQ